MGIDPAVLLLFLSFDLRACLFEGGAAVFTECRSVVFKVNVHFVQVFRLWCSLLFSFERGIFC
jgi:hypothetical protein